MIFASNQNAQYLSTLRLHIDAKTLSPIAYETVLMSVLEARVSSSPGRAWEVSRQFFHAVPCTCDPKRCLCVNVRHGARE